MVKPAGGRLRGSVLHVQMVIILGSCGTRPSSRRSTGREGALHSTVSISRRRHIRASRPVHGPVLPLRAIAIIVLHIY